jgi:PTH1 family peptidyl-tRNA hydrolase
MDIAGLLVGLGNPGLEYADTRHNFGFLLVDTLLELCRGHGEENILPLSGGKGTAQAWKCRFPASGAWWIAAKPLTFMNRSGDAVVRLLGYYRIPLYNLWVVHDELDLPLGRMRYKFGGGSAGHKGIISITERAGSPDFHRLRMGIGNPPGSTGSTHVLGHFSETEKQQAITLCTAAARILVHMPDLSMEHLQQSFNRKIETSPDTRQAPL